MNHLSDLSFFDQLIRAGSLTRTAQQLGVTTAAISKRLSLLEQRLGIRLLERTTRRMVPTAEGWIYLEEGRRILAEVTSLEETISQHQEYPRGLLRILVGFGFGRTVIAPLIPKFLAAYPEVEVQLTLTDKPIRLSDNEVDVAIRFGQITDGRIVAKKLATNRRLLCASPSYLKQFAPPKTPQMLLQHQCIDIRERDETFGVWKLSHADQTVHIKIHGNTSTNDGETAVAWATQGMGIVLRSHWHIAPMLRSNQLVHILPEWEQSDADIYAIYPAKKYTPAKISAWISFLSEQLSSHAF